MKQKYLILTLAMILTAILFFTISSSMINNKMTKITQLDRSIKIAQEKLNSAKVMDQQLRQFSLIIDNSLTRERTFSHAEVNSLVKSLADLADKNKIGVLAMYPKEVQRSPNLVEQQFILEINTTYVQLGQFLANLEALDNIVKINTLDVMPLAEPDTRQKHGAAGAAPAIRIARYKVALELSVFKVKREA